MKKSYIPVIFDTAFFSFSVFLFFLSLIFRAVKSPFSYIFSALISSLFAVLVFGFLTRRKNKTETKKKEKEIIEQNLFHLSFMKKSETVALFNKAFINSGKPFIKVGSVFRLPEENTAYSVVFSADGVKKSDVVKLYNALKQNEKGKIFCAFYSRETEEFCARFNGRIILEKADKTYGFLKNNDALPQLEFAPPTKKKKVGLKIILNKKKAKNYLVFGLIFTVMSFIVRYKFYYIAAGCFFLILAAITVVFGKSKAQEE